MAFLPICVSLVLLDIRLPRIGLAILTGGSLALAGNAMQRDFPKSAGKSWGYLGSSSGGNQPASVMILYYFSAPFTVLLFGGIAGALLSFLIVYLIAKNHGTTAMILSGLAVNMLLSAAIALLLSNAESPWAFSRTLPLAARLARVGEDRHALGFLADCVARLSLFIPRTPLHRFTHLRRRNRLDYGHRP